MIAYRSLRPCDSRLADFAIPQVPPRKIDRAYAQIVGELLQRARTFDAPGATIRRIIMLGDNAPTDGVAFENLCAVNDWSGEALIVDERFAQHDEERHIEDQVRRIAPRIELHELSSWIGLLDWAEGAGPVDESTAVVIDVDKTLLGARGRNDKVVDRARSTAMYAAVAELVGSAFDPIIFEEARSTFNARAMHPFTGDNQDYVGFLCLVVASGVLTTDQLSRAIQDGSFENLEQLIASIDADPGPQAQRLRILQQPIVERMLAGNPTPFQSFRLREYQETIACMGIERPMSLEQRLRDELVLTGEVLAVAQHWQAQGALLFALSDKPDEAALPSPDLSRQGYLPLHWMQTHIITGRRT